MTRKECIDYIKYNDYSAEATNIARDHAQNKHANYTNLPTEVLIDFVTSKENTKKAATKNNTKHKPLSACTDKGARKAIMQLAAIMGIKNIEKNFD